MNLDLTDRVAVVTGGSSGVGLAAARQFLMEGAKVVICARGADRLHAAVDDLVAEGFEPAHILARACDVLEGGQVEALREATLQAFGRVDILVCNAGQARISTFEATRDEDWDAELRLKFFSVIRPVRAFIPTLRASQRAGIVVVNSLLWRQPEPHMVCTSAARAGVINLVKSLSVELAPAIRVNSILLGTVDSGQWSARYATQAAHGQSRDSWLAEQARERRIPLGRLGRPEEPAAAIVFLASPAASYITGATLEVAGGVSRFA